ncbi:uncharacterized protein (TIGR02599 family) [Prosthecobacter fusiformis]|uniref:Uncharacterized protein (TIGR02599 family) n=1 Tax=Prosthecobacter fusiformis TaxID=48464 RepID=A0A4R7SSN9_9BACT|nr:Verru_Chthon cassette protein C [Prosthecobacter fusiformis]TDU81496.1 uncharacterized protein (TIGR02599 family) [Prosthecobacter fusiformis]
MNAHLHSPGRRSNGFTLVELLVSTAVLSILLLVTMSALETMQRSWRETKGKVNQFRNARIAFETITRNLSQATLNTYWDYHYSSTGSNIPPAESTEPPTGYVRQSELDFRITPAVTLGDEEATPDLYPGYALFFQAPLGLSQNYRGLSSLLNARGYYIRYRSNEDQRPSFLPGGVVPVKHRYQLMEYRPPAEQVATPETGSKKGIQGNTVYANENWYKQDLDAVSRPIADNILFMAISPQVPEETLTGTTRKKWWIAPGYQYSSRDTNNATPALDAPILRQDGTLDEGTRHLLPPLVRVTLIAAEEDSLSRWAAARGNSPVDIAAEADAPFDEAEHYERDLDRMKEYLNRQKLNYRVFTASIPLRNAAWDSKTY